VLGVERTMIEWVELEPSGRGGGALGAGGAVRVMTPVPSRGGGGVWMRTPAHGWSALRH
jgi:hypothetical protein